ncbi:D-tagatose-1,6-bisphosphate aldolase subunit GatY [bioreactor metagenome]|uniref:D-tagatose-1,6-bisphosphate aldolase subunit GatY n=1 Tax=bioreactor metagenome TaxID=1076179 RepID=A0A645IXI2_9ZZZZ
MTIEGELGHVGDGATGACWQEADENAGSPDVLTEPSELKLFLQETGADAVAVAVGTQHGVYTREPKLDFERLEKLNQEACVPLVLHGGSGTPDADLKRAVELGICKVNVFSEIIGAFFTTLKQTLLHTEQMVIWPSVAFEKPYAALQSVVKEKIMLLGSNDRA